MTRPGDPSWVLRESCVSVCSALPGIGRVSEKYNNKSWKICQVSLLFWLKYEFTAGGKNVNNIVVVIEENGWSVQYWMDCPFSSITTAQASFHFQYPTEGTPVQENQIDDSRGQRREGVKKSDERKRRKLKWGRVWGRRMSWSRCRGVSTLSVCPLVPRKGSGNEADIRMWIRKRKRKRRRANEEGRKTTRRGAVMARNAMIRHV